MRSSVQTYRQNIGTIQIRALILRKLKLCAPFRDKCSVEMHRKNQSTAEKKAVPLVQGEVTIEIIQLRAGDN